jgi:L-fuconolactonase
VRIDAHQHFWRLEDRTGEWPPPDLSAIHRDFMPDDLRPLLAAGGIDGTVLVQTREHEDDTRFMLGLAQRNAFIRGVVGWTDLKAPDAPARIAALSRHPALKGLRPMLQDGPPDWIADPALAPAVAAMLAHGLRFDALVRPAHLPALLDFARRHPALPIVIDHGAKPDIAGGALSGWHADLSALAALPNLHVKLSGLVTEAGPEPSPGMLRPVMRTLLSLFGPDRVLWGSDWPVLRLAGDYAAWLGLCEEVVPTADHPKVFGGNAARFYGLSAAT